jgi:hypothetical protein
MVVFCSSLTLCFTSLLLRYFLTDFRMVPVVPTVTGVTFVSTIHICCVFVVRSLYFKTFLVTFLIAFLSSVFTTFIDVNVYF